MSLSAPSVRAFIEGWIREHTPSTDGAPDLPPARNLIADGLIDSLGFLNLVGALESAFAVELDFGERDPDEFTTIGGLASVVVASGRKEF
jgi:acyl carrier protein